MMTLSRYMCAVVVLIVASLTPSSCSDIGEQAMAFEQYETVVLDEAVAYSLTNDAQQ